MHLIHQRLIGAAIQLVAGMLLTGTVCAQSAWPDRPVRLVVPYAPGGPTDIVARAIGHKLADALRQPVIIDNKPGANEMIAAEHVARSPADGYTLLFATDAALSLNGYLYSRLSYDAESDFVPITRVADSHMVLVAPVDSSVTSLKEFVSAARSSQLSYASAGAGNSSNLSMEWFNSINGIKMVHVPYKGVSAALPDLVSGRVAGLFSAVVAVLPQIQQGKLRALAMSGPSRFALLPDVPTFAEQGYPDFQAFFYLGLVAPKGTPPDAVDRISQEIRKVVNETEFRNRAVQTWGLVPVGDGPPDFAAFLRKDRAGAAERIRISGVKLD